MYTCKEAANCSVRTGAKTDDDKNVACLDDLCETLMFDLSSYARATLINEESTTVSDAKESSGKQPELIRVRRWYWVLCLALPPRPNFTITFGGLDADFRSRRDDVFHDELSSRYACDVRRQDAARCGARCLCPNHHRRCAVNLDERTFYGLGFYSY